MCSSGGGYMKIKNTWVVSIGLIGITLVAMVMQNTEIAALAVGGLVGWLAGDKNGTTE